MWLDVCHSSGVWIVGPLIKRAIFSKKTTETMYRYFLQIRELTNIARSHPIKKTRVFFWFDVRYPSAISMYEVVLISISPGKSNLGSQRSLPEDVSDIRSGARSLIKSQKHVPIIILVLSSLLKTEIWRYNQFSSQESPLECLECKKIRRNYPVSNWRCGTRLGGRILKPRSLLKAYNEGLGDEVHSASHAGMRVKSWNLDLFLSVDIFCT